MLVEPDLDFEARQEIDQDPERRGDAGISRFGDQANASKVVGRNTILGRKVVARNVEGLTPG